MNEKPAVSVVIPAYNEEKGIKEVLERVNRVLSGKFEYEILVIDDGSTDETAKIAVCNGARVIKNAVNSGYGFSLKRGFKEAQNECVVITDADGTYPVEKIPYLIERFEKGIDMVVGARQGKAYWSGPIKNLARYFFKWISEFIVGRRIPDINSGLRAIRRSKMLSVMDELSNGFSFTTSGTLMFFLKNYYVEYLPVPYSERKGQSKVRYVRDALRTLQIMVEITVRYNPIKLFLMVAIIPFVLFLFFFVQGVLKRDFSWAYHSTQPLFFGLLIVSLGFLASIFKKNT